MKVARIHKDNPIVRKLDNLDPTSKLGQYDWVRRGDYYYPVQKGFPATEFDRFPGDGFRYNWKAVVALGFAALAILGAILLFGGVL